ncbi:MAG: amino acid ABC transporter permease [Deltaproteobacteria bacterium]|nr:amino acid ABC transporter permease [Deltaproteobacteria bacterium]MBW2071488.1 amino acid ABC transporter permease [Deltaproteobacteria bacterium]
MLEQFNLRVIGQYIPLFLKGLWATSWISGISIVLALLIGVVACGMRLSKKTFLQRLAGIYIESIRSTPLLAQLYFFYFGLPSLHVNLNEVQTGILALSLNSGAYVAEIVRAGIVSIPSGQTEAATAYGLSYLQRMRYVILPQALGVTIPALLGQFIVLVKDSSLVSLISVLELTRAGQLMASERFMPAEGFFTVAAFYLLIYFVLKHLSIWWQGRLIYMEGR